MNVETSCPQCGTSRVGGNVVQGERCTLLCEVVRLRAENTSLRDACASSHRVNAELGQRLRDAEQRERDREADAEDMR